MPRILFKKSTAGNRKGMVLVLSLFAVTFLISLAASISFRSAQQLGHAKRFVDGTRAFWMAETGLNRFRHDQTMLDGGPVIIQIGSGQVVVSKNDGDDRVVTAVGTYGNVSRTLEMQFSPSVSSPLDNTISSGGRISFQSYQDYPSTVVYGGQTVNVYGTTKTSSSISNPGIAWLEAPAEHQPTSETTIPYPDLDGDSQVIGDFEDFVAFHLEQISHYPVSEILYIQTDSDVIFDYSSNLSGKKIVFVKGQSASVGRIFVNSTGGVGAGQDITFIATGGVFFAYNYQPNLARVNAIGLGYVSFDNSMLDNVLAVSFQNRLHGIWLSQSVVDVYTSYSGSRHGAIIGNSAVNIFTYNTSTQLDFYHTYNDHYPSAGSWPAVPPGFEGLISSGYASDPSGWREIY